MTSDELIDKIVSRLEEEISQCAKSERHFSEIADRLETIASRTVDCADAKARAAENETEKLRLKRLVYDIKDWRTARPSTDETGFFKWD